MRQSNPPAGPPSLIGADLVVQGTITSESDIQIDGRIEGKVRGKAVVIGEAASVEGEIVADVLTIRGRASGILQSRNTHLKAGARVEGELLHDVLTVEPGAHLDGSVRHTPRPLTREMEPAGTASSVAIGLLAPAAT
ncbi:MAG: polymer-forming cytoskeletal protein [Rhizomicrobium sp.]